MAKRKAADKSASDAEAAEVIACLKNLLGKVSLMSKPAAKKLAKKLEGVYASANFGPHDVGEMPFANLYDGDLCKSLADYVRYMRAGGDAKSHAELEQEYAK